MRQIGYVILGIFFLLAAASLVFQSSWGREKVVSSFEKALKESKLEITFAKFEGTFPNQIELFDLTIASNGWAIHFDRLEAKLSLLRLLKKEIFFNDLKGENVSFIEKEKGTYHSPLQEEPSLPYLVNVRHFLFKEVHLPGLFSADFEGYLRLGKKGRYAFLDTYMKTQTKENISAHITASLQKNRELTVRANQITFDLKKIAAAPSLEGSLSLDLYLTGPFSSWIGDQKGLSGRAFGSFTPSPIDIPKEPHLEQALLSPFFAPWSFSFRLKNIGQSSWDLRRIRMKNGFIDAKGKAVLERQDLQNLDLEWTADLSQIEKVEGKLYSTLSLKMENGALKILASWQIPSLQVKSIEAFAITGELTALSKEGVISGAALSQGDLFSQKWEGNCQFDWQKGGPFHFSSYALKSPTFEVSGQLEVLPETHILVGNTTALFSELQAFGIPDLFGRLEMNALWRQEALGEKALQALELDGALKNFYWNTFFGESLTFQGDLLDPFSQVQGTLSADLKTGRWNTLSIETAHFITAGMEESRPFSLTLQGEWTHPLSLNLSGFWQYKDHFFGATFDALDGNFFNHPFRLESPLFIAATPDTFTLEKAFLSVGEANVSGFIDRKGDTTDAKLKMENFPIDFLSLNPLDVSVTGAIDFEAEIQERQNKLSGLFTLDVKEMNVITASDLSPVNASGSFNGSLKRENLSFQGALNVRGAPLFSLDLSLPIHLEIFPFKADLLLHDDVWGHLTFNGKVEDILDFFDLGTHRLQGLCTADLKLNNTLAHPSLNGLVEMEGGYYQNYYTGTELKNLSLLIQADQHKAILRRLTAVDAQNKGSFSAKGSLYLSLPDRFPFTFKTEFSRLNSVQINLAQVEASGALEIEGNIDQATARGDVEILEADLFIPNKIPRSLPELEVTYKNVVKPLSPPPQVDTFSPYPLYLDLNVKAPDGIFVSGRGLESEWRGDFHLGGTFAALETRGAISLIKGDFNFSNRIFHLTEGSLAFSGQENEMPILNLSGSTYAKGIEIIAKLKGPLNNPQMSLESKPPLPLSSVLAYLLFGQDVSDINSFQALQLVNSLTQIAGESPGVLEKSRRALGVDRVRIVTVPSGDEEEGETIAVQVGKYVAEGVIVTFSQGASDNGGNVGVEVELKGGFSFQIETQQQQEQGKFSIKWSLNY